MDRVVSAPLFAAGLFVAMLLFLEAGRRLGMRQIARNPEKAATGLGTIESTAFALFGLLLAFTFAGAGSRFDARRELIAEEANAIGTAYLRLDLLPGEAQPALRQSFRAYLDSRLGAYRKLPDLENAAAEKVAFAPSIRLQGEIWSGAVAASRLPGGHPDAGKLLLPALNEMIDITTTRTMAANIHPPTVVFVLLFGVGIVCALLAGYGMAGSKGRSWLHILGFVAMTVITVFVILDVEAPRRGLFRVNALDEVLVELRASMNQLEGDRAK